MFYQYLLSANKVLLYDDNLLHQLIIICQRYGMALHDTFLRLGEETYTVSLPSLFFLVMRRRKAQLGSFEQLCFLFGPIL